MITKVNIDDYPGYYFVYDPDNPSTPIKFYTLWEQYGQNTIILTEDVHTEVKQHVCQGYYRIHLRDSNKKRKIVRVHNIIAKCLIENPFDLDTVDHIDNNKNNNHPSNLQWLSKSYNSKKNAFSNPKSAAKSRTYKIIFMGGNNKIIHCLKDFCKESNNYYNYHCLCKLAQNKNKTHKDIINVIEL
jgi:hypothetical protein